MVVKEGFIGSDAPFLGGYSWAHPAETTQRLLPGRWALAALSSPTSGTPWPKLLELWGPWMLLRGTGCLGIRDLVMQEEEEPGNPRTSPRSVCMYAESLPTLWDPMDGSPLDSSVHGIFQNTGVGCHTLLQEIFLTKRWNPCLLNWQAYYLPLHHLGSPVLNVLGLKCPEASQVSLSSRQACMQVRSLTEEAGTKI